jgi:hypothetical protein
VLQLTCKIANLCISPVQAGIISFKTPNSSFILDLRRRSIRLWAVFLAIFRPAALVEEGCFFFGVVAAGLPPVLAFWADVSIVSLVSPRGFICIIFRERVGGGGNANEPFAAAWIVERRRSLTASLAGIAGEVGDVGWSNDAFVDELEGRESIPATAGGGSSNDICREE